MMQIATEVTLRQRNLERRNKGSTTWALGEANRTDMMLLIYVGPKNKPVIP